MPCKLKQRRYHIDEIDHAVVAHAGRNLARPGDDQRHARQAVVEDAALALHAVLAHEVAVVGAEDDDGAAAQVGPLQRVQNLAQSVVDEAHHAVVDGQQPVQILDIVVLPAQHL